MSDQRNLKDFNEYINALMTLVEQREREQKQTTEHLQNLLTWSLEIIISYHDELHDMIKNASPEYVKERDQQILALQGKYFEIVSKRNEQFLGQEPALDDKQKHFIKLFVSGKCTDGYLMTNLRVHSWKDAEKLIEQYNKEEGTKEQ